jgi:hypothetical protein
MNRKWAGAVAIVVALLVKFGWLTWIANPLWITALATLGLAVGVVFAARALAENRRDRHIQILSDFGRRWDTANLLEAREEQAQIHSAALVTLVDRWLTRAATTEEGKQVRTLLRIPNFFEDLAIMADLGDLDMAFVAKAFKPSTDREWAYWEQAILRMQETDRSSYRQFKQLKENLAKYEVA